MTSINRIKPEKLGDVKEEKTLWLNISVELYLEDDDSDSVDIEELSDAIDDALTVLRGHGKAKVNLACIHDSPMDYETFHKDAVHSITFERTVQQSMHW